MMTVGVGHSLKFCNSRYDRRPLTIKCIGLISKEDIDPQPSATPGTQTSLKDTVTDTSIPIQSIRTLPKPPQNHLNQSQPPQSRHHDVLCINLQVNQRWPLATRQQSIFVSMLFNR